MIPAAQLVATVAGGSEWRTRLSRCGLPGFSCVIVRCRRTVMDGERFDTLLKTVAATRSRRRMLRGFLGGALGVGSVGALNTRSAAAAPEWCGCTFNCPVRDQEVYLCEKRTEVFCPNSRS